MQNASRDRGAHYGGEAPGQRTNAVRWLQKKVCEKTRALPRDFASRDEWEAFRKKIRAELPRVIGLPAFPELKPGYLRGRFRVGDDVVCERVDVYINDWWPVSGLDDIESFTRRIYRLYDAEDKLDFRAEVHEHAITGPFADGLETFLCRHVS